jgi:predicted house-cleaning NTP pyrophosphatase (Maf/HAM1 superfamily)
VAVEKIEGDIYSVIGLPIGGVVEALDHFRDNGCFPIS